MSNVAKIYSFTVPPPVPGRPGGWSCVTPCGLITAQPGDQVTVCITETWEAGADAIRALREQAEPEPTK